MKDAKDFSKAYRPFVILMGCLMMVALMEAMARKEGGFMKDNMPLEQQVEILANFLMENYASEMGKAGSEGAIEMAIRLLRKEH